MWEEKTSVSLFLVALGAFQSSSGSREVVRSLDGAYTSQTDWWAAIWSPLIAQKSLLACSAVSA